MLRKGCFGVILIKFLIIVALAVPAISNAQVDENSANAQLTSIIKFVYDEMMKSDPDRQLIESSVRDIGRRASRDFISQVLTLRNLLKDRDLAISRVSRKTALLTDFDKAVSAMRNRKVSISSSELAKVAGANSVKSNSPYFYEYLKRVAKDPLRPVGRMVHKKIPTNPEEFLLAVISSVITDDVRKARITNSQTPYMSRDEINKEIQDVMMRSRGKMPVLVGKAGVGKTSMAWLVGEAIIDQTYPDTDLYKAEFENAEIIVTSPARISQMALSNEPTAQAAAIELFFENVRKVENYFQEKTGYKKPIIVFLDNLHTLDVPQVHALKLIVESTQNPVRVIGTSIHHLLKRKIENIPDFEKLMEPIPVLEFTIAQTTQLFHENWNQYFNDRYHVQFSEEAFRAVLDVASYLKPGLGRPEAPYLVMQDLAIKAHRANLGNNIQLDAAFVYQYARTITGIPTNPYDAQELNQYLESLVDKIKSRVVNQDRIIDAMIDLWSQVLTGDPQLPKSLLISGPTGAGKTLSARQFAKEAYGSTSRFIRIDGTTMQDGGFSLASVFGVPSGVGGENGATGELMEFLDDPSRGKMGGVILIDEADKMHPDAWKRIMEFMSEGVVVGGDGKSRYANRHIIMFTSNRGTREIFPRSIKNWTQAEIDARIASLTESDIKNYFLRPESAQDKNVLRPENVARINRAVVANPTTTDSAVKIARIEINEFAKRQFEVNKTRLIVEDGLVSHLGLTGLDALEGGRPIHNQVYTYLTRVINKARLTWNIPKEATITARLVENLPGEDEEIEILFDGQSLKIPAPKAPVDNPLSRPEVREMLKKLPQVMGEQIVDQDEATHEIVTSIIAKYGDASRERPISFFLVGTTGVGKTEMGKAIARGLYGSTDRARIISCGEIKNSSKFSDVFGKSGSDFPSQFEQILLDNPEGAVIILDEVSNMGGHNEKEKDSLFKSLYTILDEGFWTSPRDGRVYDLRKFIFLSTGNDLESEMQGVSTDYERLAKWRKTKPQEKAKALLRKSSIPEAFIGRQDLVAVLKPMVGEGRPRVTLKLLNEWRARFENQHRGLKVEWDPQFLEQIATAFFSHTGGGRTVRSAVQNHISFVATKSLLDYGYDPKTINSLTLRLSVSDNLPQAVYVQGDVPKRRVEIQSEVIKEGQVVFKFSTDATELAAQAVVVTEEEARATAYREAAQFVVNNPRVTGEELAYATVSGSLLDGEKILGYSRYEPIEGRVKSLSRKKVVEQMAALWAGRIAQEKAGIEPDMHWQMNLANMRSLASQYMIKNGLNDGMEAVRVDEQGRPELTHEQKKLFDESMKVLFTDAKELAVSRVDERWVKIEKVVWYFLKNGDIREEQVQYLRDYLELNQAGDCASLLSSSPAEDSKK